MRTADRNLTRRGLVAAAATTGGIALAFWPDPGDAAPSAALDRRILTFALLLEDVQSGFYADALKRARLQGELLDYARTVGAHEAEHARTLRHALGPNAPAPPHLDFGDDTSDPERFARSALKLEDLAVKAYITQAANLTPATLASATRIATVEARHAAWIRDLAGLDPAPHAVEPPLSAETVRKTLEGSGYVQ